MNIMLCKILTIISRESKTFLTFSYVHSTIYTGQSLNCQLATFPRYHS